MKKKLTEAQIIAQAKALNVEVAALKAVIQVECKGSSFNSDGTPVILYERHKFYEGLQKIRWITKSKEWAKQYPDICNPKSGGYGKYSEQHGKLDRAAKLHREVALESCSWGIGQVMGFNWADLGYPSLQSFINTMYQDENAQLEAMCRYIKRNNLVGALQRKDWAAFAHGYNGPAFIGYDKKLDSAYRQFLK
ncbi:N-acetylmuramidase family protein [Acinetobacter proteolyticus]|uniref:Peptidoglycan-binding protein n=1 Tax=Acinetobacter proteolyticus TaxID=1776741 RepID=A0A2N0WIJ0_9GAMM|nr:N-acetylmuramidase family protein [Acinetobacter proteolyticus]PKF35581.1 peptidoglycan-binding protein [Acinetobacter proteolyticus]